MCGKLVGQQRCQLGVQRRQDVVGQLDEVDLQASGGERLDRLKPDEAGTDHDGPRSWMGLPALVLRGQQLLDAVPQSVDVGHGAQSMHGRVVQALDRRTDGHRTGGKEQRVIRQEVVTIHGRDGDLPCLAVDPGDPVAGAHVQVQGRGQGRGGVQQQLISLGDLAGQVIGQATVREGHVGPLFQDHDLGVLVQTSGSGRGTHATGHASDDDDPHAALGGGWAGSGIGGGCGGQVDSDR